MAIARKWSILLLLTVCAIAEDVTAPKPPVKFALSEVEQLRLDKIKLEAEIFKLHRQIETLQETMERMQLGAEIDEYSRTTLKSHGTPEHVKLDVEHMQWTVEEPKPTK